VGNLQSDWLTNGLVDFEYKKYVVLGYLKDVKKKFSNYKLYPFLSDLVFHYQNLKSIKENKKVLYKHFPKVMTRADFQKLKLNYKKTGDLLEKITWTLAISLFILSLSTNLLITNPSATGITSPNVDKALDRSAPNFNAPAAEEIPLGTQENSEADLLEQLTTEEGTEGEEEEQE